VLAAGCVGRPAAVGDPRGATSMGKPHRRSCQCNCAWQAVEQSPDWNP